MSIKSISVVVGLCVCAGLSSSNIYAATIVDQAAVPFSPDILIDFGKDLYSVGTVIDDEFLSSGVTFGPTYTYNNYNDIPQLPLTDGYLENGISGNEPGSIFFSLDVTAAAFSWRTLRNTTTTFSAFNDNVLVEEFTAATNTSLTSGRYFGFQNIVFDEIRLSVNHLTNNQFTLDNLQYVSAIPVPAAVWLFGSGLLGLIGVARRKR